MSPPPPLAARPVAKYFLIVCVGYAADLGLYLGLTWGGANLYAAYLASFVVGTVCNVLLLRRYFAAARLRLAKDLALSMANNGFFIALAMGIYAALMHLAGVHHVIAKVISNGFSFSANYLVRRRYF